MQLGATFKNISKVATATMGSRVLGLVRDQITFAILGVSAIGSGFLFAFNLPNLFRRLMGEGALTSSMIPVLTSTLHKDGQEAAFEFINKIFTRTFVVLFFLTLLGIALSLFAYQLASTERYVLSGLFSIFLLPYMILICLAAVLSGALNTLGIFGAPSVGPILLNACMIAALLIGDYIFPDDLQSVIYVVCGGVLLGGLCQLGLPAYYLYKKGWRYKINFASSPELSELIKLFLPALAGSAIIQINIVVSKLFAVYIDDAAMSVIYISNRLVELPLGVFAVTISTVYFPKLSLLSHNKDSKGFLAEYRRGLITTMAITIPAVFGLVVLSKDILALLFQWGAFDIDDVNLCVPILIASVIGMPFYSVVTFATKGFHSNKDTKTPMRISIVGFVTNIAFCLILMFEFKALGLALANVLAAALQSVLLVYLFAKSKGTIQGFSCNVKIIAASAIMAFFTWVMKLGFEQVLSGKILYLTNCTVLIAFGIVIYIVALKLLGFEQMNELTKLLKRRK